MYGYIDESGAPGIARSDKDYFLVCLVLIDSLTQVRKYSQLIDNFRVRAKLEEGYEFHHSRNSKVIKKEFMKFIGDLDFQYIVVATRKSNYKKKVTYQNIARMLLDALPEVEKINIDMDVNPILFTELKKLSKNRKTKLKFREYNSRNHNLIQLADYVAAANMKFLKNNGVTKDYAQIKRKCFKQIIDP